MNVYAYLISMLQQARRVLFTLAGLRKIYFRDEETDQLESKWELVENLDDQTPTPEAIGEDSSITSALAMIDSIDVFNNSDCSITTLDVPLTSNSFHNSEKSLVDNCIFVQCIEETIVINNQPESAFLVTEDAIHPSIPSTPIISDDNESSNVPSNAMESISSLENIPSMKRDKPRSGSEISACSTISCIEDEDLDAMCDEEGKAEVKASKKSKKRSKKKSSAVPVVPNAAAAMTVSAVTATASSNPLYESLNVKSLSSHSSAPVAADKPPVATVPGLKSNLAPKKRNSHHKPKRARLRVHWGVVEEVTRSYKSSS